MPEGDILRRTATGLDRALAGRTLVRSDLRWPDAAGVQLAGRTVLGTTAYGKHLLTRFDDGRTLHTHLRMEGSWRVAPSAAPGDRGPHVRAVLAAQSWTAVGERLGMLDVLATRDEHTVIGHLGPDVLADDFPTVGLPLALERFAAAGPAPVAEVLLDQRVQAGIGTIWTAESLFARGIWPWTPADELVDPTSLLMTARVLMARSVAAERPSDGRVHGRRGRPCPRCGTPIARGVARRPPMERPVFWCPVCQARP
ncbi:MAG TPA: DNA-formamidopyrimidine glycosylase family protein [Actinotalea sp.]|nr:DNA-formamidopyrimidine glycosylase family protein [Actinotalea sp.]